MNFNSVQERIEPLIDSLNGISTPYGYERVYIGEAQVMLRLLKDILENQNEKE